MRYTKSHLTFICCMLFCFLSCGKSQAEGGFLRTKGHDIVDENGNKILLRGVGLGNWLLPEGYMWKFGKDGDRPRKIEKIVEDLIGKKEAEQFWLDFRKHYITEADIQRIAELGFNSVRPALNARRFLTEDKDPVYVEEGFELLDNLIEWCKKYKIYVIIDMHGAPGGQTGQNIDDSPNDLPELFMDTEYQDRLVDLWVKIATRYKDEPIVAAYDLLNEPLPARTGAAEKHKDELEPLYKRITKAIRKVDQKHMITLEGADWSNDWSVFSRPFDDNVFYQFHYYCWNKPDNLNSIEGFIERREELDTPVWVGETGEKGNTIYWATMQYFEENNIGWSFWPWKKMDTINTPYSIRKPAGWDAIADYSRGGKKPDRQLAGKAFDELLENIKLENCDYFPDVVNAIFRRVPGKVEAENYGHKGLRKSYYVKDTSRTSEFYRTAEPVPVEIIDGTEKSRVSEQCIRLVKNEWTAYDVNSLEAESCKATVRAKAAEAPIRLEITLNGEQTGEIELTETEWTEKEAGPLEFKQGENSIKIKVLEGTVLIDWFTAE